MYFVTQNPTDVPDDVLSQLGLKVQHALRAFTAKDRKAIKLTAENYPLSDFYKTDEVLTSLGIGEALISALDEKGRPTPLAATLLRAPMSRMDVLTQAELSELTGSSTLIKKYNKVVDRESAYELLVEKIEKAVEEKEEKEEKEVKTTRSRTRKTNASGQIDWVKPILKVVTSATFIRGVMGILQKATRK